MVTGLLDKGVKLSHSATSNGTYTDIEGLMEFPSMGGSPNKVDVTTLEDNNYRYIKGLIDYGDLTFKYLYDNSTATSNYRALKAVETAGTNEYWKLTFADNTVFAFQGYCSVSVDGAGVNSAHTFSLTILLNSDITITNPV